MGTARLLDRHSSTSAQKDMSKLESNEGQNPEGINESMDVAGVAAFLRNQGIPEEYCKTFEGTNSSIKRRKHRKLNQICSVYIPCMFEHYTELYTHLWPMLLKKIEQELSVNEMYVV